MAPWTRLLPLCAAALTLGLSGTAAAAPPSTPTITEPSVDNAVLNPADVHMEAGGFSDPDGGTHQCSDWEIQKASTAEPVWQAPCVTGLLSVHIHLGDGSFVGSYAGRTELEFDTDYILRVRFRDDTGEASDWSTRPFSTSPQGPGGTPGPMPWAVRQPGFVVEPVATDLKLPVNVAFAPNPGSDPGDPFLYITELYGSIKVIARDGTVSNYATGLLNFNPTGDFPGSGEQGVTGITVDPASGDVFASMVYESNLTDHPHFAKVVRFHSTDGGKTAASQTTILDMPGEFEGQSHQVSNLTIGPDGELYVHNGDGFDPDAGQNLAFFRGKVLRMNLDGSAASDNPFYNASDGITARDYIFSYGFRNPFGGAWRAKDGSHYEVENGPAVDRFAQVVRGRNYLYDGTDPSMRNFALYNWDPSHAPVSLAFVQPETFSGSGFPFEKRDHAYVSESGPTWATGPQELGKRIVEFAPGADGTFAGSKPVNLVEYTGVGKATAAGLAAGPDGLYFTELYKDDDLTSAIEPGARLMRVRWIGDLTPPAVTVSTPADGSATNKPLVSLGGAAGTDTRDSDTVTVKIWSGDSASGSPLHTLTTTRTGGTWSVTAPALAEGTYTVRAEQDDSAGNSGVSAPRVFAVDTTPPELTLTNPADGSATDDPTVRVSGTAGNDTRDSSTVAAKVWEGASPSGPPLHTIQAARTGGTWSGETPALAPGTYTARAEQSDSAGNRGVSAGHTFRVKEPPLPPVVPLTPVFPPPLTAVLMPAEGRTGAALHGVRVTVRCTEACAASTKAVLSRSTATRLGVVGAARSVVVARGSGKLRGAGQRAIVVRFTHRAQRALRDASKLVLGLSTVVRRPGRSPTGFSRRLILLRGLGTKQRLRRGLRRSLGCSGPCRAVASLSVSRRTARRLAIGSIVGRGSVRRRKPGTSPLTIRFTRAVRRSSRRAATTARLQVHLVDANGRRLTLVQHLRLRL